MNTSGTDSTIESEPWIGEVFVGPLPFKELLPRAAVKPLSDSRAVVFGLATNDDLLDGRPLEVVENGNTFELETDLLFPIRLQRLNPLSDRVSYVLSALGEVGQTPTDEAEIDASAIVRDGLVAVEGIASGSGTALQADLEQLGLQDASRYGRVVSGWLPTDAIANVENLSSLEYLLPTAQPIKSVGATTSQGVAAIQADLGSQQFFGVDGSGITIGVLSDSYNNLSGAGADIASGDLPGAGNPFGRTSNINVIGDLPFGGSDEGRAMMQLIHDVAPGATLLFRTAFLGSADFAQGIGELVAAGADIIVDDIGYLNEPFFQDGIIAQAADAAAAAGVAYFSAAGNSGRDSYESDFRLGLDDSISSGYIFHDFNPGSGIDIYQQLQLGPGKTLDLSFQWDSPFASAGGSGSTNDLDIFLLNSSATTIVAGSVNNNIGNNAVELLSYTNFSGSTQTLNLAIGRYVPVGGSNPGRIKYINFGEGINFEYATNSPTSFGHPTAAGAAGVGAAFYGNTPAFGTTPPVLESFSSAGGTQILFDTNGNLLAQPEIRNQPRFTAPDGTNTTFFGSDFEGDGFPNFFGTSAAAPHAAAAAALLLDAQGGPGKLSPQQIYQILEETAVDMGQPGYDFNSGFGLIDVNAALEALPPISGGGGGGLTADFNDDGKVDILWRNTENGNNSVWLMDDTNRIGVSQLNPYVVPTEWSIGGLGDFNSDGEVDILWRNSENGTNSVWFMNDTQRVSSAQLTPSPIQGPWRIAGVADFNNDGKDDVLWRNRANGEATVWYMDGVNRIGYSPLSPTGPTLAWDISGIGDFNNDDRPDILWRNSENGLNTVWFLNDTQLTGSAQLSPGPIQSPWRIAGAGDFNNDGNDDVLWRNRANGEALVWYMDGVNRIGYSPLSPTGAPLDWEATV
ncbi:FG-GAP-like repeat-containing protein [Rubidibacter lacunae]|uniref:FG-GAP-like repeat-containing protein n=1 Tax=Rubidibacter lacunae TaxID=582514 RepID=UPI0004083471|nr:FG-GAP-like repeat-containing protein [Rubidibacter lacunae]